MDVFYCYPFLLYIYMGGNEVSCQKEKMKEYTILAFLSIIFIFVVDNVSGVRIFKRGLFWLFLFIIALFKLLVNGYLTKAEIIIYNPKFFLGFRVGSIPVEDFIFGFSMVSLSIICWEYFKK